MPYAGTAQRTGPRNPILVHKETGKENGFKRVGNASNPYIPDTKEQEFLSEVYSCFDPSATQQDIAYHRQWWLSMAYFLGLQWMHWSPQSGKLEEKPRPSWKVNYTANKIFPKVLRAHTKLMADEGMARMAPMTNDAADKNASKLAESVFEYIKELVDYDDIRALAELWAIICGSGFVRWWWNPAGGGSKTVELDGKPVTVPQGDIGCDSFGPMAIRKPSGFNDIQFMPWLAICYTRSHEYVVQNYPDMAVHVVPDVDYSQEAWLEERINAIVGHQGIEHEGPDKGKPNLVRFTDFVSRPSVKFPRGLCGTIANGVPLFTAKEGKELINPYEDFGCALPVEHYRYARVPGRFFGMGLVEQLIPPQTEYNRSRSRMIENNELMSRPKWIVPKGHGIPRNGITSKPGEVIEYNASAGKPEQIDISPLPTWVVDAPDRCEREMQDIAAQQDVTEAKAPASIRSGVAINMLQAADNAAIGYIKRQVLKTDQRSYRIALQIVSKQYKEPRLLQIVGKDGIFMVRDFVGADLRGHTDIRIFAESGMLDTKAARQQTIMDYVELGILNPADPDEKTSVWSALELGEIRSIVKERLIDEQMADFENTLMAQPMSEGVAPEFPQPRDFEDHEVHIKRHNLFRKSFEYRALPPNQAAAIDAHVEGHQMFLQQQVMSMNAQNESQKGMPGEKGEASTPGGGNKKPEQGGNEAQNNESKKPGGGEGEE